MTNDRLQIPRTGRPVYLSFIIIYHWSFVIDHLSGTTKAHGKHLSFIRSSSGPDSFLDARRSSFGPQTSRKSHHSQARSRGAGGKKLFSMARSTISSTWMPHCRAGLFIGTVRSVNPPVEVQ